MSPLVSAIICTYNRAQLLPRAIEAILAQTHRPLQLIVINDGSKDGTPEVLQQFDGVVRQRGVEPVFVSQENTGLARARNAT